MAEGILSNLSTLPNRFVSSDAANFTLGGIAPDLGLSADGDLSMGSLIASADTARRALQPSLDALVKDGIARVPDFNTTFSARYYDVIRDIVANDPQNSAYMDRFATLLREYNRIAEQNPSLPKATFSFGIHPTTPFSGGAATNDLDYDAEKNTLDFGITLGDKFLNNNDITGDAPTRRGSTAIPSDWETMFRPPEIALSNELAEQIGRLEIITDLVKSGEDIETARMVAANIIGAEGYQEATWAIDSVFADYAYETTGAFGSDAAARNRNVDAALADADPAVLADLLNQAAATVAPSYLSNPYVDATGWEDNIANYDALETPRGVFGHASMVREEAGQIETLLEGKGTGVVVTDDGAISLGNARDVAERQLQRHLDAQLPASLRGQIAVELVETEAGVLPRFSAR